MTQYLRGAALVGSVPVDEDGAPLALATAANQTATGNSAPQTQDALRTTKALTGAVISASSSGDNTLVAAVASQTTRVHRLYLVSAGTVSVTFKNGAGTALTGAMPLIANQGIMMDFSSEPWFVTSANTAFIVNLSGAVAVTGRVEYVTGA